MFKILIILFLFISSCNSGKNSFMVPYPFPPIPTPSPNDVSDDPVEPPNDPPSPGGDSFYSVLIPVYSTHTANFQYENYYEAFFMFCPEKINAPTVGNSGKKWSSIILDGIQCCYRAPGKNSTNNPYEYQFFVELYGLDQYKCSEVPYELKNYYNRETNFFKTNSVTLEVEGASSEVEVYDFFTIYFLYP